MKKKYFFRSFIHHLTLEEYQGLIGESLEELEGQEFLEVYVLRVIDNVKKHQDALNRIVKRRRFHDSSTAIQDMADERHKKLRSIVAVSKAMQDAETDEKREAAAVVSSFARKEQDALSRRRIKSQTAMVVRMMAEADRDERLEEAMETLGLEGIYEEVLLLTMEIQSLRKKRRNEKRELSNLADNLRRESYKDFVIMLDTLENSAYMESVQQSLFQEICDNLENIFTEFRVAYLLRTGQTEEELEVEVKTETDVEVETETVVDPPAGSGSVEEES